MYLEFFDELSLLCVLLDFTNGPTEHTPKSEFLVILEKYLICLLSAPIGLLVAR